MVEEESVITTAIDFWRKLFNQKEAVIKFTKKDGSIRIMRCTLDFKRIPKKSQPKSVNIANILKMIQSNGIIHVFDVEKKGWRSVPFKNVDWLETPTKRYKIRSRR